MRQSAFVTGATGFVGSHLVRRLVGDGADVHILRRACSDFWRLADVVDRIHAHDVSLADPKALRALIEAVRPERIFHLATATVVAGATLSVEELIAVNFLGAVNLIDAAERVDYRSLVVTGDSFEYTASECPLREADRCEPDTPHGITKLGATLYAASVARRRSRPIVTLRLFSTYGPGDNPRRLVPRVIDGALSGTPIRLSRPGITRDWVYVDDVVDLYIEASARASELAGNVYNAGSGVAVPIGSIVDILLRLTGSRANAEWGAFPAPPHDVSPWVADTGRNFAAFRWRPRVPLEEGLSATVEAHRQGRLR